MKHLIVILCCIAMSLAACSQGKDVEYGNVWRTEKGITFTVDDSLPAPTRDRYMTNYDGDKFARSLLRRYKAADKDSIYIASSFRDAYLQYVGKDVLFKTIVKAYAEHRPLVLSPDMIWLNICQVFSNYVNANAEAMRHKFVDHDGQMSLVVESQTDILTEDTDWRSIMDGFITQIGENTKDSIADVFVADFSTTGEAERIASGITLMDAMKSYFDYVVIYIACGIPEITLTGTPDDWRRVLDKTTALEKYGMEEWIERVKPVLAEFVKASEGKPNFRFWRDMVMLDRPDRFRGGACSSESPTVLTGWFLRLFPYDKDGKRAKKVTHMSEMLAGMVNVPFRYINASTPDTKETPMELWAGFVGVEEDSTTLALTPKIGWIVRKADTYKEQIDEMRKHDFSLRVKEVPQVLSRIAQMKSLELYFIDKVSLPEWMEKIKIGRLIIHGKMSEEEKADIKRRFPTAEFPK